MIWARACLAALLLAADAGGDQPAPEPERDPVELGMTESTGTGLAQLDVTATGPREALDALTAADFRLKVERRKIRGLLLDRACPAEAGSAGAPADAMPPAGGRNGTFLFYFDQPHLTLPGRQRAIDLARAMIPPLVSGGARVALVSNATALVTLEPPTTDAVRLARALDRLEQDRTQWDLRATSETERVRDLEREFLRGQLHIAMSTARRFHSEELGQAERDLRRLEAVLGRFVDVDQPKAVVYFADTMRWNAGEHYMQAVTQSAAGQRLLRLEARAHPALRGGERGVFTSAIHAFDRLVRHAAAVGVRFYPVQAEGLAGGGSRTRDAQDTLSALALETGGSAFLNGVGADRMVARMQRDFGCLFLVSFDPADLPRDRPLSVDLEVLDPRVRLQVRGILVVQSQSARTSSRLLAAWQETGGTARELRAGLVPLGFRDGRFSALLQVSVPPTAIRGVRWDLGASLVSDGRVHEDTSGRVEVRGRGIPVVLEREVRFPPGDQEIVAVAHETTTDRVLSSRVGAHWPDPNTPGISVAPVAVLQPVEGAFTRDGDLRTSGTLSLDGEDAVDPARPTALVSLVCRPRDWRRGVVVRRTLAGASSVAFDDLAVEFDRERCAQVRDVVPAATLGDGAFVYEIEVLDRGHRVGGAHHRFRAASAPS